VRKEGYEAQTREVEFSREGPRMVMFDLSRLEAALEIATNPPGAEVLLNDQRQPGLTPSRLTFAYGEHRVTVRKEGFHPVERVVQVNEKTPARLVITLIPAKEATQAGGDVGRVSLRTQPGGASVLVDGKRLPNTRTPVNIPLPVGKHTIGFEQRGYFTETREITVTRGEMVELDVELKPTGERRRRLPFP
jgi:hypothetical protein